MRHTRRFSIGAVALLAFLPQAAVAGAETASPVELPAVGTFDKQGYAYMDVSYACPDDAYLYMSLALEQKVGQKTNVQAGADSDIFPTPCTGTRETVTFKVGYRSGLFRGGPVTATLYVNYCRMTSPDWACTNTEAQTEARLVGRVDDRVEAVPPVDDVVTAPTRGTVSRAGIATVTLDYNCPAGSRLGGVLTLRQALGRVAVADSASNGAPYPAPCTGERGTITYTFESYTEHGFRPGKAMLNVDHLCLADDDQGFVQTCEVAPREMEVTLAAR